MSDRETIDFYDRQAADYAARFGDAANDRHLAAFMARLPEGSRVLDLGCGPGHAAARMAAAGFAVEAWDAAAGMVALAARHAGVTVRQARFEDLDAEAAYAGIWANFSLLHAPREAFGAHLGAIARALVPGGLLHLGLKTGTGTRRDRLGRRYSFFTEPEIDAALAAAGFSVLSRHRGAEAGLAGTVDPFVILLAEMPGA